jgi:hypothetical protein
VSLADTAKLAVDLTFKSNAPSVIGTATKQLTNLEASTARMTASTARLHKGFVTLGAGIGTAIRNGAVLAAGAVTSLIGLIALSVKEGQEALKVEKLLSNAVAATNLGTLKGAGNVNAADYRGMIAQQAALLQLTGKDDELIATIQTRLLGMQATGKQTLALTPLIVAAATATGRDVETVSMAVGKAVQGSLTSLKRIGITSMTRVGTAYAQVLAELTKRFGGVSEALKGTLEVRLSVLRENLANIREDMGMKLLPSLTRVVDVVGSQLVPAFGKFVDSILPDIIRGIEQFAAAMENGGAERAIKGITDALGPLVEFLKISAGAAKTLFDVFMKLPGPIQGLLVGGFAVNKLSGGLIGAAIPDIVGGLLGSRGSSPANPMYVSDVAGALGGAAGKLPGVAGAVGNAGAMLTGGAVLAGAALSVGAVAAVGAVAFDQYTQISNQSTALATQAAEFVKVASLDELRAGRQALIDGANKLAEAARLNPLAAASNEGLTEALKILNAGIAARETPRPERGPGNVRGLGAGQTAPVNDAPGVMSRAVAKGFTPTASAITATLRRNSVRQETYARRAEHQAARALIERGRDAAAALTGAVANANRIVSAILGINIPSPYPGRQGENDVNPAPILPGGDARGKMTPSPGSGDFRLTVKAVSTARDVGLATQKRTAYNGAKVKAIGLT